MEIHEIVKKLSGCYKPTGMHEVDMHRLENAKKLTASLNTLISEIWCVQDLASESKEASVVEIREHLKDFLIELKDFIPE